MALGDRSGILLTSGGGGGGGGARAYVRMCTHVHSEAALVCHSSTFRQGLSLNQGLGWQSTVPANPPVSTL